VAEIALDPPFRYFPDGRLATLAAGFEPPASGPQHAPAAPPKKRRYPPRLPLQALDALALPRPMGDGHLPFGQRVKLRCRAGRFRRAKRSPRRKCARPPDTDSLTPNSWCPANVRCNQSAFGNAPSPPRRYRIRTLRDSGLHQYPKSMESAQWWTRPDDDHADVVGLLRYVFSALTRHPSFGCGRPAGVGALPTIQCRPASRPPLASLPILGPTAAKIHHLRSSTVATPARRQIQEAGSIWTCRNAGTASRGHIMVRRGIG